MTKMFSSKAVGEYPRAGILPAPDFAKGMTPNSAAPAKTLLDDFYLSEEEKKRRKKEAKVLGADGVDFGLGASSADNSSAGDAADGGPW